MLFELLLFVFIVKLKNVIYLVKLWLFKMGGFGVLKINIIIFKYVCIISEKKL